MNLTNQYNTLQKNVLKVLFLLVFTSFSFHINAQIFEGGDAVKGEKLFKSNCAACHKANNETLAAPGLGGIAERWGASEELLVQWIKNPKKALDSGDPYIKQMYAANKQFGMMAGQLVEETDIKDIMAYIQNPPVKDGAPKTNECETIHDNDTVFTGNSTIWYVLIALLFVILAATTFSVSKSLKTTLDIRDGKTPVDLTPGQALKAWMWKRRVLVGISGFVITCWLIGAGYGDLMDIGVYEGYEPEQPIQFSHSIHNCENDIDCEYCHFLARKSKHAGIPPVNVCMNCHKGIKKGSITGDTEISKIHEAIGFDPKSGSYIDGYEEKPIKWVKVHNLPDHVYFSHQQHVEVGDIDCKQCHGPVDTFVSGRIAPVSEINAQTGVPGLIQLEKPTLTMAWCVECHNKKEIDLTTNGYYEEMHKRMTEKGNELGNKEYARIMDDGKVTVREMGGWECAKCHY